MIAVKAVVKLLPFFGTDYIFKTEEHLLVSDDRKDLLNVLE